MDKTGIVNGMPVLSVLKQIANDCEMKHMQIEVKDTATGALLLLNAKPEHFKGMQGFRIMHPNGSSFFIANQAGTWRSADDHHIDADFLINIGLALEGHKLREQAGHT